MVNYRDDPRWKRVCRFERVCDAFEWMVVLVWVVFGLGAYLLHVLLPVRLRVIQSAVESLEEGMLEEGVFAGIFIYPWTWVELLMLIVPLVILVGGIFVIRGIFSSIVCAKKEKVERLIVAEKATNEEDFS